LVAFADAGVCAVMESDDTTEPPLRMKYADVMVTPCGSAMLRRLKSVQTGAGPCMKGAGTVDTPDDVIRAKLSLTA